MRNKGRALILGWIHSRQVCAVHLGTPCQSFSRARDQPGGPPPLRSDALPLGLPDRRPGDQRAIEIGSALMVFSASVMRACARFMIPATMENPGRSRIWLCPPIVRLINRSAFSFSFTEFCMNVGDALAQIHWVPWYQHRLLVFLVAPLPRRKARTLQTNWQAPSSSFMSTRGWDVVDQDRRAVPPSALPKRRSSFR